MTTTKTLTTMYLSSPAKTLARERREQIEEEKKRGMDGIGIGLCLGMVAKWRIDRLSHVN